MAKYIQKFDTEADFLVFKNSDEFLENTISYVLEDDSVWFGSKKRLPSEIEEMANNLINNIINTER
jgi:hypothetical protein